MSFSLFTPISDHFKISEYAIRKSLLLVCVHACEVEVTPRRHCDSVHGLIYMFSQSEQLTLLKSITDSIRQLNFLHCREI